MVIIESELRFNQQMQLRILDKLLLSVKSIRDLIASTSLRSLICLENRVIFRNNQTQNLNHSDLVIGS